MNHKDRKGQKATPHTIIFVCFGNYEFGFLPDLGEVISSVSLPKRLFNPVNAKNPTNSITPKKYSHVEPVELAVFVLPNPISKILNPKI